MDAPLNQIFTPVSFNDLFSTWNRYPDGALYAGGTDLTAKQGKNMLVLPKITISLEKIDDLRRITRTEQYLEIGAMVKLNQIFRLGKIVPSIIYKCLENIAGAQIRNIATIGGNICALSNLCDLPAVFTAVDAQYELRTASSSRWIAASRFHEKRLPAINKQEILSRIRIPLARWDYSIYKKILSEDNNSRDTLVFMARAQKTILTDIRIVYKSNKILRNRNAEDAILGKNLPISRKSAMDFVHNWKDFLKDRDDVSEFSKNALLNNIEENVFVLSE